MLFNTSTIEIQNLRISVQWSRWDLNPQPAFTGYTIQRGRLANLELQLINPPLRVNNEGKEDSLAYLPDHNFSSCRTEHDTVGILFY